jgi:hypothetical protein
MVTMHRGSGWKIAIYGNEHGVPHFHIEGPGFRCSIGIATEELIIGNAPPGALRAARIWARGNRVLLLAKWRELNQ